MYNISGVLALLESSPDVEKLVVEGYNTDDVSIQVLNTCYFKFMLDYVLILILTSNVKKMELVVTLKLVVDCKFDKSALLGKRGFGYENKVKALI